VIPHSFLQDLLNRVDIVDVVGKYVQLKKGGANFMGLCPFHNEKSPRLRLVRLSSSIIALAAARTARPSAS
jgi:DNA primase